MKLILMAVTLNRLTQEGAQQLVLLGEVKQTENDEPYLLILEEDEELEETKII